MVDCYHPLFYFCFHLSTLYLYTVFAPRSSFIQKVKHLGPFNRSENGLAMMIYFQCLHSYMVEEANEKAQIGIMMKWHYIIS